ncbi:MAG: DUF1569 domain-containing protein [Bacteroidota bacterium]
MGNILKNADYEKVLARIEALSPENERKWGKMTVYQMLAHVADQLRGALFMKSVEEKSNFFSRNLLKRLVLAGMEAPKGKVTTAPEFAAEFSGTPPTEFQKDRETLKQLLSDFRAKQADFEWQNHPSFGRLTKNQWGKLVYSHLNHHLKQFGI